MNLNTAVTDHKSTGQYDDRYLVTDCNVLNNTCGLTLFMTFAANVYSIKTE